MRNPDIKLYGLAWGWPVWITCANNTLDNCQYTDPFTYPTQTANYITKWVAGAKNTWDLDIDYIGTWNERYYNTTYIKVLRSALDAAGLNSTMIVAPDEGGWDFAGELLTDPELADAVWGLGSHYPGTLSTPTAIATGKPLWASEDSSTYNNDIGAGCWARAINQNFVNGNLTASIIWNLAAGYEKGTHWYRTGLLNALSPWNGGYGSITRNGNFTVGPMVWATAHTTQFASPGWYYLPQTSSAGSPAAGTGSGLLVGGGSYITMMDFTSGDVTIVIEKMSRNHSACVRGSLAAEDIVPETATFTLDGNLSPRISQLYVWYSHWAYYNGDETVEFQQLQPVAVVGGSFTINITVDSMYTLTTLPVGGKGSFASPPPPPSLFPAAHTDNFEACAIPLEANYFSDQNGAFECYASNDPTHGIVMRQSVPLQPLHWYDVRPHSFIGHRDAFNSSLVVDGFIEEPGASIMLAVRVQGTDSWVPNGLFWSIVAPNASAGGTDASAAVSQWSIHYSIGNIDDNSAAVLSGNTSLVMPAQWHTYRLDVNGSLLNGWIDDVAIFSNFDVTCALPSCTQAGHALIGTTEYGHFSQFDNFQLYSSYMQCGSTPLAAGAPVSAVECASEVGSRPGSAWSWSASTSSDPTTGIFSLRANSSLCLAAVQNTTGDFWPLQLKDCDAADPLQIWRWDFTGISPDGERSTQLVLPANGRCMDISALGDIGSPADAWPCNGQIQQYNFWDYDASELGNEGLAVCLGVC